MHLITNKENISFCFVISSFNNSANIEKNLTSIIQQTYTNWRAIYTNDCSTDTTDVLFHELMEKYNVGHKFTYILNSQKCGQMHNKYHMYKLVHDLEIVCLVDGDDWLLHENVLNIVKEHYSVTNTKLCTSNYRVFFENKIIPYIPYPSFYSEEDIQHKHIRYCPTWYFKHLKTGYGILFKSIPKSYLQMDHTWLTRCTDCAEMYSASEFSNGKVSQIQEPLYVYNKDNSLLYNTSYYVDKTFHSKILNFLKSLPICTYIWPFTYIINMPKDTHKKHNMINQLIYMNNPTYEFIEAIDGGESDLTLYHTYLKNLNSITFPKTKLYYNSSRQHITKGSFGLLQSVFKVLQTFIQQDLTHIVLFEDDVYSHKDLQYYYFLHEKFLKDKDIIYLGCHHNKHKMYQYVNDRDVFINVKNIPHLIYGTYAMIVSKKIAQFIVSFGLEAIIQLNLSWDLFLNYVREQYDYTFYLYFKQLFIPNVTKDGINGIRTMSFYKERNICTDDYFMDPIQ